MPALHRNCPGLCGRREVVATLIAGLLGRRPEVSALMFKELPVTRGTAWLEIRITAGTNTPTQKAAFIEATYAALQRRLGMGQPLAEASYVIVRELPVTDWATAAGRRWRGARGRWRVESVGAPLAAAPGLAGAGAHGVAACY